MKRLIFTLFFYSFITQAAEIQVNWNCPQENYPGVPQLEQQQSVKVVLEDGNIKFKPDPFKAKLLGDSFFRSINPLNKTKKSLGIDYTQCINSFVASIKEKVPDYKDEWERKIKAEIAEKSFLKKNNDKKLLPTQWEYNKRYNLKYDQWREKVADICSGKSLDYIGPDLLKFIDSYATVTNTQPSKKCMDSIVKTVTEKASKDEAEYCEYSEKICKNLQSLKTNVEGILATTKAKREKAMAEAEAKFEKIMAQDNEAGFEDGFNSMFSKSPSDCAQYTTNIPGPNGNYGETIKMHNLISKNMDKFMDHMDGSCQQKFLRSYMDRSSTRSLIGDWGIITYCEINETEFCNSLKNRFKIVEDNIERMLEKIYGKAGKEFYTNVACEINPGPNSLDDLLGQLKQFDKSLACRTLEVGESQVVQTNGAIASPTGISMNYSLERTGDKKYKARFNLNFNAKPGTKVSGNEMFNRAQACMKDLSPYFRGPDGEVMEVDIINSADAKELKSNQRPPKLDIGISPSGHRSNSGDYEENIPCGTIAHEVMHLMGLCDEYSEQWTGNYYDSETGKIVEKGAANAKFLADYNCRVVAPIPSIMSHQNEVIDAVVPKAPICKCESSICTKLTSGSKKMQDLYIKDAWGIGDTRVNSKYCEYKTQAPMTLAEYEKNGELLTLNSSSDDEVSYSIRYFDNDEKLSNVQNLKINCKCESGDNDCSEYLNKVKGFVSENKIPQKNYCPSGANNIFVKTGRVDDSNGVIHNDDGTFTFNGGFKDEKASLLHPQHFARVIGGTCAEKGKEYSSCAKFAYKTDPSGKCPEVPKECADPKYFLGTGAKQ